MYEIIEKEFKKNNPYQKYRIYYWVYFFMIFIVMVTLHFIFKINGWILWIILYFVFILSIYVYVKYKTKKYFGKERFKKDTFKRLLHTYIQNLNSIITDRLVNTLKENNVNNKDKIRILIDYYNKNKPLNTKLNPLEIIASIFVSLASLVVIAYNDITKQLDINTFVYILYYTFIITLFILLPMILIHFIFKSLFLSKEFLNSSLLGELTYIYMNYENYKEKLNWEK